MPDWFLLAMGLVALAAAWWMRTHEWSKTANDRAGYEYSPTRGRRMSYEASDFIGRVLAPVGLLVFGLLCLAMGTAAAL